MGRKTPAGLFNRNGKWHIDKVIGGQRICKSCGTSKLEEAEKILAKTIEEHRQAKTFGIRPKRTFDEAAAVFVTKYADKKSIDTDISKLRQVIPHIGHIPIDEINRDSLDEWVSMRQEQGLATNTINHGLKIVRRVLNVAAKELYDDHGMTWLAEAPFIKELTVNDKREPYPITWEEQTSLLEQLPRHLQEMALFTVNTGCRDQEVCHLRWEWEVDVPELNTSVFILPPGITKGKRSKVIVLNAIARGVIDRVRGNHSEFVFSYRGNGIYQMNNTGWKKARLAAGLPDLRVHDLRHTFATRLRALDTSFEDRRDLLGHKTKWMTEHYSHVTIGRLIKEVEKLCPNAFGGLPKIVMLRVPAELESRKFPAGKKKRSAV